MEITVTINLFAKPKEVLNSPSVNITIKSGSTARDCLNHLGNTHPILKDVLSKSKIAKDCKYIQDELVLTQDCSITIIPPISGG